MTNARTFENILNDLMDFVEDDDEIPNELQDEVEKCGIDCARSVQWARESLKDAKERHEQTIKSKATAEPAVE